MPNWNRIPPKKLEVLIAVLRHGSTVQASKMIGTSQSNVSKMIKTLEDSLGIELFVRKGGRLEPTTEALRIGEIAERTLNSLDDILAEAAQRARVGGGNLRIGALPTFAGYILPEAVTRLARSLPMVDIYASIFPHGEMYSRLRDGDIDCALVHFPNDEPDIGAVLIAKASLVAVMRSNNPLARNDHVSPEDLEGQQVITFPARLAFARIIRNLVGNDFGTRRIQTNYTSMAMQIAARLDAVAIVDQFHFGEVERHMGLCKKPLDSDIGISMGLIHSTTRKRPELLKEFESILRQIALEQELKPSPQR